MIPALQAQESQQQEQALVQESQLLEPQEQKWRVPEQIRQPSNL